MLPRAVPTLCLAIALPLLAGACGVPAAVTAGSYAADGGLALTTNKTTGDHFLSMVSKEDCSMWRLLHHQAVCKDRPPGAKDPYDVNYNEPFRDQSEGGGVQYRAPLEARSNAPAASWDAAAYKPAQPTPAEPTTAVADNTPAPTTAADAPPPAKKKKAVGRVKAKKPAPGQVASGH
ncbi:MAG TPA: hypothetical protein VFB13_19955 [Reyranella sp.]|nr:hypothetical protein [Reyranella sp.]